MTIYVVIRISTNAIALESTGVVRAFERMVDAEKYVSERMETAPDGVLFEYESCELFAKEMAG